MSGICAVWRRDDPQRAADMLATVSRGLALVPEERVEHRVDACAGVGVSSRFRTQQILETAGVLIACDAELYNEDELRELASNSVESPENVRTAALLVALYERFGAGFVERLRGAFSVVLWDRRNRKLLAAIDGFGVGRLVWCQHGEVTVVSSRINAIARLGEIDLEVNPRAIANILNFTSSLAPETIFTQVRRLSPGSLLIVSEQETREERYWDMRYGAAGDCDEERLSRELESLVEQSVAVRCKDDSFSRLGAYLSGGTDSSTVVGMMSRMGKGPAKAFSIGFQEQPFNELGYAELAARKFRADHHTFLVGAEDCFEAVPNMVRFFDEPFGNSSAIPTYFCARLAAQNGVNVLLAGDGGDELFGGNERYLTDKIFEVYQAVPATLRKRLIEPVLRWVPVEGGPVGKARRYIRRSNIPSLERFFSYHFLCANPVVEVFEQDFLVALNGYSVLEVPSRYYSAGPARDHLDRLLYTDVKMTLADNDLPKVTCMSELAGVQTRFPFLDRQVAEFSGRIPARLKVKGFEKRYLFKQAFRNLLPIEIIRKKKHGFGIPVAAWMKSDRRMRELTYDTLLSSRAFGRGYFRRSFIEDLFRRHEADDSTYYGDSLWTFLMIELWHRQAVDQPARVAV